MAEVYIRTDKSSGLVTFIHRRPFDPVHGLGETRENLLKTGFFVSNFPEPVTNPGTKAVAYYDHEQKKVVYKYEPISYPERTRLSMLEDVANNLLMTIGPMRVMTMSANSVDNSESSDNTMMNGLARYLATQIYQNKLDREAVLNTYPDIKDDIESYLSNMEIIPVVTDEE